MSGFLTRSSLLIIGRLLLAAMLFVQGAMAVQACVMPRHAPLATPAAESSHPCHGKAGAAKSMSANLCAVQSGDQSTDTPQITIHAMPALPVLQLTSAQKTLPAARDTDADRPHPSGGPPLSVLFQVYRS